MPFQTNKDKDRWDSVLHAAVAIEKSAQRKLYAEDKNRLIVASIDKPWILV